MQSLVEGLHQFQANVFGPQRALFSSLVNGQEPEVLFITCSDSRIVPNLITQTEPGDLFTLRNAGNIVPAHGSGISAEAATIEYAVRALHVSDIIVCGHSHCGAMKALLDPQHLEDLPAVAGWIEQAADTRRLVTRNYGHLEGDALCTAAAQENALLQLYNLRTHPAVTERLEARTLYLHAWLYMLETGEVYAYDPAVNQYVDLTPESTPESGELPITRTGAARPSRKIKIF
jgi:carbonic anhydrase